MPAPVRPRIFFAFAMRASASSTVLCWVSFSRFRNLERRCKWKFTGCNIVKETHCNDIATSRKYIRVWMGLFESSGHCEESFISSRAGVIEKVSILVQTQRPVIASG